MDDNEKPDNEEISLDLEEASSLVEEASIPAEHAHLNEELCNKLLDFPPPKFSLPRSGVKSLRMELMVFLGKIDPRRLKDKLKHEHDCCTHEFEHCGKLIKLPLKVRGSLNNTGSGGTGSYHAANASRHLESHCNEASLHSIESLLNERGQTNET